MSNGLTSLLRIDDRATFPLWIKVVALLFLSFFIVTTWSNYGYVSFLWFSCIGLIGGVVALWIESRLLASMMLLGTFIADEVGWGLDFFSRLVFGRHLLGNTAYMFDPRLPLYSRGFSLYHFVVPAMLAWMVYRLRYDRRAFVAQTLFGTVVLLLSYSVADPTRNINCVFGLSQRQTIMPGWLWLAIVMVSVPIALYLPVHFLMRRLGWDKSS
jgi:hypothetical protein